MFRGRREGRPGAGGAGGDPALVLSLDDGPPIDLNVVVPRLRQDVWDAVAARQRWTVVVAGLAPGPLRDRLAELGARIDAGVREAYATARRVGEVEQLVATLEPERTRREYKAAKRRIGQGEQPPGFDAVEARFNSVQRLLNLIEDTETELASVDARLGAAVARAVEVAVTADAGALPALGADVDQVVAELDALRHAFDGLG